MLSLFWIVFPIVLSVIAVMFMYKHYFVFKHEGFSKCPIPEEPIIAIFEPRVNTVPSGKYQVGFRSSNSQRFWLSADEIIERCVRHQSKVPFIVGSDSTVTIEYPFTMGDDLLIITDPSV